MPNKSSKTSQVTVERPTFLAGFSMGSKYHEDRNTIQHQLQLVRNNHPANIYTFLADIQHWSSTVAAKINKDLDLTEEGFEENKVNIENDALYESYIKGQEWLQNNKFLIDSDFDESVYDCELNNAKVSSVEICDSSSDDTTVEPSESSILLEPQVSSSTWASFDSDTTDRLKVILESKGERPPDVSEKPVDILKSLLFKSIFLNSIIYYYQGSLAILSDLKEKKLDNKYIEKQREELGNFQQALVEHDKELERQNVPNIYEKYEFDGTKKSVSFAKQFSSSIFTDISEYLNRNQRKRNSKSNSKKKTDISISDPDWRVQLSIMYSVQHQCQNLASIGIYSLVHGVTYFTYPRSLGYSPNLFTGSVLPILIKNLYKEHPVSSADEPQPAFNYRDHLTYFYKDNTTLYYENDDRLTKDEDDNCFITVGEVKTQLKKVPPPAAQSKVIVSKTSIKSEIIEEMQEATQLAFKFYNDSLNEVEFMSLKFEAVKKMEKYYPAEFNEDDDDFFKSLFNWSSIEAKEIQEHFRKSNLTEEENTKLKKTLCKILFILELMRCVGNINTSKRKKKKNTFMEPVLMFTLKHFGNAFSNFLLSIEKSCHIKETLQILVGEINDESKTTLARAGDSSSTNPNDVSLDWAVTQNILVQCLDEMDQEFIKNNTPTPTPVKTPPRKDHSVSDPSSNGSSPYSSSGESSEKASIESSHSSEGAFPRNLNSQFSSFGQQANKSNDDKSSDLGTSLSL